MAKLNKKVKSNLVTHEGAVAKIINPELQLRRSVMSCLLWEDSFYEQGEDIAERIKTLVHANTPSVVSAMAIEARSKMNLRHVPLLLCRELARHKKKSMLSVTLEQVIQRADELSEFLSIYWKEGRQPLSAQVKKGLAKAFNKFSEYDLAKYNRDEDIKLRDVLFLCHAKPKDDEQAELWKRLIDGKMETPDTWEVALSAGVDKRSTWERLIKENKLGALAFLRNLRNMKEVGVNESIIFEGLSKIKTERVLPFRFVTAARYAPQWEDKIEAVMMKCLSEQEKLKGKTVLLVDVSGSMNDVMSGKSEATRIDTACGLAILLREICEDVSVYTFSDNLVLVPPRHGFALRDAINGSQNHHGTCLGGALNSLKEQYDRLIVITDEQSHDRVPNPKGKGYMINVASYKNGVGYGSWTHIDGFSESVIKYIIELEKSADLDDEMGE